MKKSCSRKICSTTIKHQQNQKIFVYSVLILERRTDCQKCKNVYTNRVQGKWSSDFSTDFNELSKFLSRSKFIDKLNTVQSIYYSILNVQQQILHFLFSQSVIKLLYLVPVAHKTALSLLLFSIICRTIHGNVCTYFWLVLVNESK